MREDLLRLTPEALAQLTNMGLLKRAQRDLDEGNGPTILLEAGELTAIFQDATRTTFAEHAGLKESACSCNAPMCRHRIATVLHYRKSVLENASPTQAMASPNLPAFADLTDEALTKALAQSVWKQVQIELQKPVLISVDVQVQSGSSLYTARLSQASARFYAGADLSVARCDCVQQQRCVHIGLGAIAIRQAERLQKLGENANTVIIEIGAAHKISSAQQLELGALETSLQALQLALFEHGLAFDAASHCALALSSCQLSAKKIGATWIAMVLDDLEACLANYQSRSAAFSYEVALRLSRELTVRARAMRARDVSDVPVPELSMQAVLGMSEAMESALDRLSLVSLGLRIQNDGAERTAQLAVVDTDTQTLMVMQKSWQRSSASDLSEQALSESQRIGTLRMSSLAKGSLITTTAKRRANGELKLGQSFSGKAAVTPHSGDFSSVRAPLLMTNQQDYLRQRSLAAPPELAARALLRNFHVLNVSRVDAVFFDAAHQCLCARVQDSSAATWLIKREYNAAAPGALDALAKAFLAPNTEVSSISGQVRVEQGECIMEPWALCLFDLAAAETGKAAATFVVPDLAQKTGALNQLLLGQTAKPQDPIAETLIALNECLIALLRDGALRSNTTTRMRLQTCAQQLRAVGLLAASGMLNGLVDTLARHTSIETPGFIETPGSIEKNGFSESIGFMAAITDLQIYLAFAEHSLSNIDLGDS